MTQTLLVVVLFVGAMACLPWLVKRVQLRHAAGATAAGAASRVLSAVAVGPQQRVVTVEVGPEHARTWLVLGVTAQNVSCLHVLPAGGATGMAAAMPVAVPGQQGGPMNAEPSFAHEVAVAVAGAGRSSNG